MMKKAIILGMIVCSILAASTFSVKADDNIIVPDKENDVVLNYSEIVPRPNIDISSVSCIKTGVEVEISLTLIETGKIQNNEYIFYTVLLTTSENEYEIYFLNGECIVNEGKIEGVQCSGIGTNNLTTSFNLLNSDEDPLEIYGMTVEVEGESFYMDDTEAGEPSLTVDIGELYEGKVGESISFTASVENGTPPYKFQWNFDDEETSEEQNPSHVFNEEGTYNISLIVTDNESNYGFDNATVIISGSGSGNNDKSDSSGSGLTIFIVLIAIIIIAGVAVLIYIIRK